MKLTRRTLLVTGGAALGVVALPIRPLRADAFEVPAEALAALDSSPLVYVSPLKRDGSESTCHGEVWFFWDTGGAAPGVVLATAADTWKARAVGAGLDQARIWVGDHGRGQQGPEGPFRQAPGFRAKAEQDKDPATFERLMTAFATRYAAEWDKWGPRFRNGYDDGSRSVLRYTPVGA